MTRRAWGAALLLLAFCPAARAQSWTDATRVRMIQDALKITPPALQGILEHYDKELVRGMLDPSRHEGEEVHYQLASGGGGLAAVAIEKKIGDVRALLSQQASFSQVTYQMGILAHLVADVEFPLSASDSDPREPLYRDAYRLYVEKMLDRIPFVVDRVPPATLVRGDVRAFVKEIAVRAGRNYPLIGPAFKDDGTPRAPGALDERSVPFGIASLSYSHATSDIVWVWRHLWSSINGDMHGTPYLEPPPKEKLQVPVKPPKGKRGPAGATPSPTPAHTPAPTPAPTAAPAGGAP